VVILQTDAEPQMEDSEAAGKGQVPLGAAQAGEDRAAVGRGKGQ
jgi:hypothetical protein